MTERGRARELSRRGKRERRGRRAKPTGWPLVRPAVSGAGSLPFREPRRAVALVLARCPDAPYWPQLPRRGPREGMIAAVGALARGGAAALGPFLRAAAGAAPRLVKGQVCGPLTLAANAAPRAGDASLAAAVSRVARDARAQVRALARLGRPVLIVLDEPALATPAGRRDATPPRGGGAAIRRALAAIRSLGALAGVHCCGAFDLSLVPRLDPDVLSFDADRGLEVVLADPHVRRWRARGRVLALGVVPTRAPRPPRDRTLTAGAIVRRLRAACRDAGVPWPIEPAPLLTGACGFGLSSAAWTRRAHVILAEVARLLGRDYARSPR